MNMYRIDGCECLIEELQVGDRFTLIQLTNGDINWVSYMRYSKDKSCPDMLQGEVLTVLRMGDEHVDYSRRGGYGSIQYGAIVLKL